ncbi:MAG: O-antigen ligase family protein [Desulfobacteraceae bacterium]|nr:O-antigen ligase family protein [Desulfobacteraceae bacterium]
MTSISEPLFKKAGINLFLLFAFSIFIAKPAINISYTFLILAALIYLIKYGSKDFFTDNPYVLILLFPVGIGFILSFFSMAGIKGSADFILRYRFLFLVLPFAIFITNRKILIQIIIAMNAGALIDVIYCMLNSDLSNPFGNIYGIHKFGRHSDMLFTLCLINTTFLLIKYKLNAVSENIKLYSLLLVNTCIIFTTIILIGQRGAYLGLYFGLIVLFILYSRKLFVILMIITALSPLFAPEYVLDRAKSIIAPSQHSNSQRLKLLKTGTDLFIENKCFIRGTGAEDVEPELEKLFAAKPQSYRDKYYEIFRLYPGNFHNSYLQMAVEGGLLFLILYLSAICYLLIQIFKKMKKNDSNEYIILPCVVVSSIGFLISQFFHEEFFRYGGLVFFTIFYGGCMIENSLSNTRKDYK